MIMKIKMVSQDESGQFHGPAALSLSSYWKGGGGTDIKGAVRKRRQKIIYANLYTSHSILLEWTPL